MMKRLLKWLAVIVLVPAVIGFFAFLYFIPPFLTAPPETFSKPVVSAAPLVKDMNIADPAERALAEHGRYLVQIHGCIGCHATNGSQGPDYSKYLAGGGIKMDTPEGTFVSRNLTPDKETGLAARTDDEVKRVLRSGTFPDGHVAPGTVMPWPNFSNWTEEDRQAVLIYLRHLPPVRHKIPDRTTTPASAPGGAVEADYGGKDYGTGAATTP